MKVGVFGKGKTGSHVIELIKQDKYFNLIEIFDQTNPPTKNSLNKIEGLITFVPAPALLNYFEVIRTSNVFHICASTGFNWDEMMPSSQTCIHSDNFALGMSLIHNILNEVFKFSEQINCEMSINEIHHTKKLDAPSGTAKMWSRWLGNNVSIQSERIGDVIGEHELTIKLLMEEIKIKHSSLDRKVFAQGAIWAMKEIVNYPYKGNISLDSFLDKRRKHV